MSGPKIRSKKGDTGETDYITMGKPEEPLTPLDKVNLDLYVEIKKNQEGTARIKTICC